MLNPFKLIRQRKHGIKLEGLRLYVHPKDQYPEKKKTWKHFHLQLTAEIYMADEAEKKQTGYFSGTDSAQAGFGLVLLPM